MNLKKDHKEKAIHLRKQGKTYSEILKQIPVAKSTISLWLRDVGLAKKQAQRITQKRIDAQKKAAAKRKEQRLLSSLEVSRLAAKDIDFVSDRELWLIGIVLYWAEGSKQKDWNVSQSVQFANSDPTMIKLYIHWLTKSLDIAKEDIVLSLAIHENNKYRLTKVIQFWQEQTGFRWDFSGRVYFKSHKPKPGRYNLGETYYGTVRVTVRRSTSLNRKIAAWTKAICGHCGVV